MTFLMPINLALSLTNEEQKEYEAVYLDYETRIILYGFQLKRK